MRNWPELAEKLLRPPSLNAAKVFAAFALTASLCAGIWLFLHHVILSGPGDQLFYHAQAQRLIPFTDHWYGPGYFVALRLVHDLLATDWLTAGKILGFASTLGILVLCWHLFRRVLPPAQAWLAIGLFALLPDVIHSMYSDLTVPFGTFWVLVAVTSLVGARADETRRWLLAGALFGVAALVRFQSFGFLLGAVAGTLLLEGTWPRRVRAGAILLGAAILPNVVWQLFLVSVQGSAPQNWNFVHLTTATGEFDSFLETDALVQKYGSFWGLLASDPVLLPKLLAAALKQTIRFPLDVGARMFGPAALWLGPGVVAGLFNRAFWSPWAAAICAGFLITAPTQQGWTYYFLPMLPLLVVFLVWGVELPGRTVRPGVVAVGWMALIAGTLIWSIHRVPRDFAADEWKEFGVAKAYLNRGDAAERLVSTTASSISYGAKFRFADFDALSDGRDNLDFVNALRAAGVTHVVVSARHSLYEYPSQAALLADTIRLLPAGLIRDTLILTPQRLAIFRLLP